MSSIEFAGGSLKLKGIADGGIKKKKKKSKKSVPEIKEKVVKESNTSHQDLPSSNNKPIVAVHKTPAELKFEEIKRKRQQAKVEELAAKSHKDRVAEFNRHLESLSEHYDIPKVGPG